MENPLYDPYLDDLPARPPVAMPTALDANSRTAPAARIQDVDGLVNREKGAKPRRGGAGWFAGLGTARLIVFSLAFGLGLSTPIALVLQPELRRPWPWYFVSVIVALVGTVWVKKWVERSDPVAGDPLDLDVWEVAVLSGQHLLEPAVASLLAKGLLYCPPTSNAILPKLAYTGDDPLERAIFNAFPRADFKWTRPEADPASHLRAARQEVYERLRRRKLVADDARVARYEWLLLYLWSPPMILIGLSLLRLLSSDDPPGSMPPLAPVILILTVVHLVIFCKAASGSFTPKGRLILTRQGRRALDQVRRALSSSEPWWGRTFASLSPHEAALSVALYGIETWLNRDHSLRPFYRRFYAPPASGT
jgi:uncharacterized protein (TIGR04222 family)